MVTGGADPASAATCARLAQDGFSVAALDLRPAAAVSAAALTVSCDVTDESDVTMAMATVANQLGAIGVLVNNAGITGPGRPPGATRRRWRSGTGCTR